MRARRLILRVSLALFVVCASTATIDAQVFYNSVLDSRTKAALAQYEATKAVHIAYLDSRVAEIDKHQATLAAAASEAIIAERDRKVAAVLGEDQRVDAADRLRRDVGSRLNAIVPGLVVICPKAPCRTGAAVPGADYDKIRDALMSLDAPDDTLRLVPRVLTAREQQLATLLGGEQPGRIEGTPWTLGWFCRVVFPTNNPQDAIILRNRLIQQHHLSSSNADKFMAFASTSCDEIAENRLAPSLSDIADAGRRETLLALSGFGGSAADEDATLMAVQLGRRIADIQTKAAALKSEIEGAEAIARGLKEQRDGLVKRWTTDATAAELAQVASCIAALLDDNRSAACKADASGATAEQFDTLFSAIAFLTTIADAGPELQRIREEEAFEVVQYLANPTQTRAEAEKQCKPGTGPAPAAINDAQKELVRLCLTDAVVRLVNIGERAGEISKGVPGRIAAFAVQIADADLKAEGIRLRARALAERANNLDAQRRALLRQAKSLMEVLDGDAGEAGNDSARLDRAVFRLADVIGRQQMDYELPVARYGFIGQREFAQRERAVTAGRYAISDALLMTLATSTSGGIKPEQVAGLLSAVGLTAVGITEVAK